MRVHLPKQLLADYIPTEFIAYKLYCEKRSKNLFNNTKKTRQKTDWIVKNGCLKPFVGRLFHTVRGSQKTNHATKIQLKKNYYLYVVINISKLNTWQTNTVISVLQKYNYYYSSNLLPGKYKSQINLLLDTKVRVNRMPKLMNYWEWCGTNFMTCKGMC